MKRDTQRILLIILGERIIAAEYMAQKSPPGFKSIWLDVKRELEALHEQIRGQNSATFAGRHGKPSIGEKKTDDSV